MKLIVGVLAVILVSWIYLVKNNAPAQETGTAPSIAAEQQTGGSNNLTKPVSSNTYSYDGQDGKTALELLKAKYPNTTTESSTYGDYVTGIDGVKADSSKEYWAFYVNGEVANEGAGTYQTKSSDKIEWRLELM